MLSSNSTLHRSTLAVVALVGFAWLVTAPPVKADDEDDARKACEKIAEKRDWNDTDTEVRREGEDRIVIVVRGERDGDNRQRRCVYNTKTEEARFVQQ